MDDLREERCILEKLCLLKLKISEELTLNTVPTIPLLHHIYLVDTMIVRTFT